MKCEENIHLLSSKNNHQRYKFNIHVVMNFLESLKLFKLLLSYHCVPSHKESSRVTGQSIFFFCFFGANVGESKYFQCTCTIKFYQKCKWKSISSHMFKKNCFHLSRICLSVSFIHFPFLCPPHHWNKTACIRYPCTSTEGGSPEA